MHQVDAKAQLLVHVAHPAAVEAAHPAADGGAGNAAAADGSGKVGIGNSGTSGGGGSGNAPVLQGMDDGEDAAALQAALEGASSPDLEVATASGFLLPAACCCAPAHMCPAELPCICESG